MKTKYDIGEIIIGFEERKIVKYKVSNIEATGENIMYRGDISARNPDGTWTKFHSGFSHYQHNLEKYHNQYTPEFIMETFGIEVQAATVYFKDDKEVDDILVLTLERIRRLLLQEPDENTGCPTDGECVDDAVKYINDIIGE